jgi:Flp pilus assembly protein TadD
VSASTGRPPVWVLAALLVAAGAAAFANSLSNPFLFDDTGSIVDNPTIRNLSVATWKGPVQSATAGRPVVNFSLALNYALGGLAPSGYHLWNLAVHLLCGLLLFGIVRRTLERLETPAAPLPTPRRRPPPGRGLDKDIQGGSPTSSWLAFACALLWLVHPLQSEVIDYVTQRTESMMGLFYLLSLYAAIRGWTAIAIAACALGMLTKESMVTAPVMVLLYDVVFVGGSLRRALRERWRRYAGLAATWAVLFMITATGPRWRSAGFSSGVSAWTYLLNQPPVIVDYLRRTFWPTGLLLDYGVPHPITLTASLPAAAVLVALAAVTLLAWLRRRELAYLGVWFFVTLAPTSSFVPIATEVGAERRMYLPLAAVVTLVVVAVHAGARRMASRRQSAGESRPSQRVALGAVLAVAAGVLITVTIRRNQDYTSGTRIWETVVEQRPHGRAHYNLGLSLMEEGRRAEALAQYQVAVDDAPDAHYALGFELESEGDHLKAIEHLQEYIRLKPEDINVIRTYNLLGRALVSVGRDAEAMPAFQQVLRMQPRNLDAIGALADLAMRQRRFDAAISGYQEYVRLAPQSAPARFNLGLALANANRLQEAADAFAEAVRMNPRQAAFQVNLAEALVGLGRLQEAVAHYSIAVQLEPDDQELFARMSEVVTAARAKK